MTSSIAGSLVSDTGLLRSMDSSCMTRRSSIVLMIHSFLLLTCSFISCVCSLSMVIASDPSHLLEVSEDTSRRDLRELEAAGELQRVHGGALPRSQAPVSFIERQRQAPGAKDAIAQAAIQLIHQDQIIILDGGTT